MNSLLADSIDRFDTYTNSLILCASIRNFTVRFRLLRSNVIRIASPLFLAVVRLSSARSEVTTCGAVEFSKSAIERCLIPTQAVPVTVNCLSVLSFPKKQLHSAGAIPAGRYKSKNCLQSCTSERSSVISLMW